MDLGEKSVKFDLGMELKGVEGEEIVEVGVGSERELEVARNKCKELEGRSKKAEDKCMALELEIEKRKTEFELLQGKFSAVEVKKCDVENEIKVLKGRNAELERRITLSENKNKAVGGVKGTQMVVDLTEEKDEEDKVIQLMIENKVLECEKKRSEIELDLWKLKCGELESQVLELQKENLILRGGQSPLAGMVKTQLEMHKKQTTDISDLKGRLDAVTSSEHLETESEMVDKNETVHYAVGMSSTSSPPLKGIEDLQLHREGIKEITI